jgi:hypothetical protein
MVPMAPSRTRMRAASSLSSSVRRSEMLMGGSET